jgi:hypothetical protein
MFLLVDERTNNFEVLKVLCLLLRLLCLSLQDAAAALLGRLSAAAAQLLTVPAVSAVVGTRTAGLHAQHGLEQRLLAGSHTCTGSSAGC